MPVPSISIASIPKGRVSDAITRWERISLPLPARLVIPATPPNLVVIVVGY